VINQYEPERLFFGHYDRELLGHAAEVLVMRYPQAQNLVPFAAVCTLASQNHKVARRIQPFLPHGIYEAPRVPNWVNLRNGFERWCNAREIPGGESDWIWGSDATYGDIAFDSDSRYIWCGRHQSQTPVTLLDLKDHETAIGLEGPGGQINDLAFDADRKWILASTLSTEFQGWVLWNIKNPDEPIVELTEERCQAVALSPTGNQFAIATKTKVKTFDVETRTAGQEIDFGKHIHALRYSPNGKLLGINATVWDATTGEKKYEYTGNQPVAFDEQQRPLATFAIYKSGSSSFPLYRYSEDGKTHETLIEDLGPHGNATAISRDEKLLAVAEQTTGSGAEGIKVFDLTTAKLIKRFGGHWSHIGSLAFSPDGKKLASIAATGGVIKIWSLGDNTPAADH
jgi:WD40 repeat protein